MLNYGDDKQLKKEYENFLEENFQLSEEVIKQIKDLGNNNELTPKQKLLIRQLVPNEKLRNRYEKYGLCEECQQPNSGEGWCQSCNAKHFQEDFNN